MIDLHALANQPGYGKAEAALRKAGKWDDTKIIDGIGQFVFEVEVKGWYEPQIETQTFTVTAQTEDEALDMAEDMSDFDEIDDATITAVKEAKQ